MNISVCIATYRRPERLRALLDESEGPPFAAASTSSLTMRPLLPDPFTDPRLTPRSRAILRTPGLA